MSPAQTWLLIVALVAFGVAVVLLINYWGARKAIERAQQRELAHILRLYRWSNRPREILVDLDTMSADQIRERLEAPRN